MGLHWNGASTLDREDREGLEKIAALGGFRRNWSPSRGPEQTLVDLQPSQVLLQLRTSPTWSSEVNECITSSFSGEERVGGSGELLPVGLVLPVRHQGPFICFPLIYDTNLRVSSSSGCHGDPVAVVNVKLL